MPLIPEMWRTDVPKRDVIVSGLQEGMGKFSFLSLLFRCVLALTSTALAQLNQRREDRRAGKDVA